MFSKKPKVSIKECNSVVDGLKQVYFKKIKPVEDLYKFHEFSSPPLRESDFEAKPMVLLLGQYSTGKTSFIRYILGRDFPGQHIGPEPTTDRFIAVMHSDDEKITPGNALAVQADKPFRGLEIFGNGFLSKFQSAEIPSEILEGITLIDTPGVLSGEKQRLGRSYDFVKVCEWFAERADLILLLFDAHKLDISDEFKRVIECLKGQDDKIRVILNKADMITTQQLMRVYGAMMWSLGKVVKTPEVMRVYIGSFWDEPCKNIDLKKLFEIEQEELLHELHNLPANSTVRKVNELVKRARLVKVHAYIISHLKKEMPSMFGKDSKQKEIIGNLQDEFVKIQKQFKIPPGDFPDVNKYKQILTGFDLSKFAKLNPKLLESMDEVLGKDLTDLLMKFEKHNSIAASPSSSGTAAQDQTWIINDKTKAKYLEQFRKAGPIDGKLSGAAAKQALVESGLGNDILKKIWFLSDIDKDGQLDEPEFCVALHLTETSKKGIALPASLPLTLVPTEKMSTPF